MSGNLTDIFNTKCMNGVAKTILTRWFNEVKKLAGCALLTIIGIFVNHYDTIPNFFVNRQKNAGAKQFNAKVMAFRIKSKGITDIPFFLFRLSKLCA